MSDAVALVRIVASEDNGFEAEVDVMDMPVETVAAVMRSAADILENKYDRASGCWGR